MATASATARPSRPRPYKARPSRPRPMSKDDIRNVEPIAPDELMAIIRSLVDVELIAAPVRKGGAR